MDVKQLKERIVALGIEAQQLTGQHPGQNDGLLWDMGAALILMGRQNTFTENNTNTDAAVVETNCRNENKVNYSVPNDFIIHQRAWRAGLELAMKNSFNEDERSYWQHEIHAFDRAYTELLSMFTSPP